MTVKPAQNPPGRWKSCPCRGAWRVNARREGRWPAQATYAGWQGRVPVPAGLRGARAASRGIFRRDLYIPLKTCLRGLTAGRQVWYALYEYNGFLAGDEARLMPITAG